MELSLDGYTRPGPAFASRAQPGLRLYNRHSTPYPRRKYSPTRLLNASPDVPSSSSELLCDPSHHGRRANLHALSPLPGRPSCLQPLVTTPATGVHLVKRLLCNIASTLPVWPINVLQPTCTPWPPFQSLCHPPCYAGISPLDQRHLEQMVALVCICARIAFVPPLLPHADHSPSTLRPPSSRDLSPSPAPLRNCLTARHFSTPGHYITATCTTRQAVTRDPVLYL